MAQQVPVSENAEITGSRNERATEILPDLAYRRVLIANVVYFGAAASDSSDWVLIDAGVGDATDSILRDAQARFGDANRLSAIVMTHGHFDHYGALRDLAERFDVPIYAHSLELSYLNGDESYPPPDPSVGGGLMSTLSRFYPRGPIDVSKWLIELPGDGQIPGMPGWQWLHTPGHTRGHVSLWRESDRTIIAGDAFITTAQESAYAVTMQRPELHGPPMYYTTDWESARESVRKVAALKPEVVITGHGPPLGGPEMRESLETLAREFDELAVPAQGRYVPRNKPPH